MREKILVDKEALRNILLALSSDKYQPIEKIRSEKDQYYNGEIRDRPDLVRLHHDLAISEDPLLAKIYDLPEPSEL